MISKFKKGIALVCMLTVVFALAGCDVERRKSDAELGLSPQQAAGRKVFDQHCDRCHESYSTRAKKADSLKGVFQQQYLRKSGLPAKDERVEEIIRRGRGMMPAFGPALTDQQIDDLLVYLHTL